MRKYIIVLLISLMFGEIQIDHSFNIHFGTIHRVDDFSFIKVPFRLSNYSNRIGYGDFELNSKFALEFSIKDPNRTRDGHFIGKNSVAPRRCKVATRCGVIPHGTNDRLDFLGCEYFSGH